LTGNARLALWVVGALSLAAAAAVVYLGAKPRPDRDADQLEQQG